MSMTRRQALASAGAAAIASGLAKPAIAAKDPILIGYLPALTGPSSSTGIGINRGIQLAVQEINDAGGIDGRTIELITRDTQSDPTKAVNGAAELTRGQKVSVVFGPVNSGESLAVVPLLARTKTPQVHPCWVDSLTDPKKYPMCFRNAPTNQQIGSAANRYVVEVLKRKKVAVISDTTGYGTASVNAYVPMLEAKGATVVYRGNVDAANPDLKPELLRMQSAGAEAIMPWSVNAGFLSRIINTRGEMGWDVPIVGQTTLGSGQTQALLEKPEYWAKVYPNNFRTVCYGPDGKLSERTVAFLDRLKSAKIEMGDTLLWWIALGYDSPRMIAEAMKSAGTDSEQIVGYLNKLKGFPGVYGDISFSPDQHDGYPDDEVVMVKANSLENGAFNLAPGYSA
ncbi:MAG TPA: ABC transporter substrate-binding protein [Xanthobacteraceae bacterium]|jgi:branched-chain amino acid transport system substrate-binding protein